MRHQKPSYLNFIAFTIVALLLLTGILTACDDDIPEPEKPTGDPTVTARDFIEALFGGNASKCRELSTDQIRLNFLELCTQYANANADIDLSQATFEVVAEQAIDRRTVKMTGIWAITADTPEGQRVTQVHDTNLEPAVLIGLLFKDGKWRVDGMDTSEPPPTLVVPTPTS
jgi:hypothetical protein